MEQSKRFCSRCKTETAHWRDEWDPNRRNSCGEVPGLEVLPMLIYSYLFGPLYGGWQCRGCQSRSIKVTSRREWEKKKAERRKIREAAREAGA